MMFRKVDGIPKRCVQYKKTKLQEFLMTFIASGYRYAEVDTREYKTIKTCYTTLKKAIQTHGMVGAVGVYMRGGKVYIENMLLR